MDRFFGRPYRGDPGVPHSDGAVWWLLWGGSAVFSASLLVRPYLRDICDVGCCRCCIDKERKRACPHNLSVQAWGGVRTPLSGRCMQSYPYLYMERLFSDVLWCRILDFTELGSGGAHPVKVQCDDAWAGRPQQSNCARAVSQTESCREERKQLFCVGQLGQGILGIIRLRLASVLPLNDLSSFASALLLRPLICWIFMACPSSHPVSFVVELQSKGITLFRKSGHESHHIRKLKMIEWIKNHKKNSNSKKLDRIMAHEPQEIKPEDETSPEHELHLTTLNK
ncbi:hypothetical protein AKJ16_DCAP16781 [Drosera capensis]